MATTDVDRLHVAWDKLRKAVNTTIPNMEDKVWAARNRLVSGSGNPPKPS